MATNTYVALQTQTLGSAAASVTFSSIPSTYTDLMVRYSIRGNAAYTAGYAVFYLNGDTSTSYTNRFVIGDGTNSGNGGTGGGSGTTNYSKIIGGNQQANSTANVFSNGEFYIPNYRASIYKTIFGSGVGENNGTNANSIISGVIYPNTTAITSLSIVNYDTGGMAQYSTAYLYGIKNS
jgi:hypothetical protein